MPYELGVDLGTTFTAAAVREPVGRPTMVGLGNRALQVPSVLLRTGTGFVVGEAAERRGSSDPRALVREFKRRIGDPVPILVDGVPFSAEMLSGTLLRWVVDAVTRRQGEPPTGLVLTHPASWSAYRLDVLHQVVTLAEVGPARWCAEPVAAAAQYASRSRVAVGERLGVYDLGGGTFDACVLEKTEDGFAMLGPAEGVEHLGGVDFDVAVVAHVSEMLADRLGAMDPDDPDVAIGLARLRRECVEAKEALSVDVETTVPVALPGLVTSVAADARRARAADPSCRRADGGGHDPGDPGRRAHAAGPQRRRARGRQLPHPAGGRGPAASPRRADGARHAPQARRRAGRAPGRAAGRAPRPTRPGPRAAHRRVPAPSDRHRGTAEQQSWSVPSSPRRRPRQRPPPRWSWSPRSCCIVRRTPESPFPSCRPRRPASTSAAASPAPSPARALPALPASAPLPDDPAPGHAADERELGPLPRQRRQARPRTPADARARVRLRTGPLRGPADPDLPARRRPRRRRPHAPGDGGRRERRS